MIKLQARFGYIYHNKSTDTYSPIIYLPDNADLSNFEEVIDTTVNVSLKNTINNIIQENDERDRFIIDLAYELAIMTLML